MALRRRELRCCFVFFFVVLVIITSLMYASEYLPPQVADASLPNFDMPDWLRPKPKLPDTIPEEFLDEEVIQGPNTHTITSPISQPTTSHDVVRPAVLGPNDVWTETTIPGGAYIHGITVLDDLYMKNGTFFILTPDVSKFPSKSDMIAKPLIKGEGVDLEPTDQDLRFLHPHTDDLGRQAIRVRGLSVIVNDPSLTMNSFYNWWGEIVLGAWRVYSKLAEEDGHSISTLPLPSRFILPVVNKGEWRDDAKMTGPLMRAAFPHVSVEQSDFWQDLVELNSTVVFDRVVLVSREAAYRHPNATLWLKMISGAMSVDVPTGFWQPLRDTVVRNVLGYLPVVSEDNAVIGPPEAGPSTRPVVTYISRQDSARRLDQKDHEGLIDALRALEREGICEFNVLEMERATLTEQLRLTAKSTILIGVHGVGLTHQLWMTPSPRSALLEIVWPKATVFDHEIISRSLGHKHYAVWNDTLVTYMDGTNYKGIYYGENFDSSEFQLTFSASNGGVTLIAPARPDSIPVYGVAVAEEVKARLSV